MNATQEKTAAETTTYVWVVEEEDNGCSAVFGTEAEADAHVAAMPSAMQRDGAGVYRVPWGSPAARTYAATLADVMGKLSDARMKDKQAFDLADIEAVLRECWPAVDDDLRGLAAQAVKRGMALETAEAEMARLRRELVATRQDVKQAREVSAGHAAECERIAGVRDMLVTRLESEENRVKGLEETLASWERTAGNRLVSWADTDRVASERIANLEAQVAVLTAARDASVADANHQRQTAVEEVARLRYFLHAVRTRVSHNDPPHDSTDCLLCRVDACTGAWPATGAAADGTPEDHLHKATDALRRVRRACGNREGSEHASWSAVDHLHDAVLALATHMQRVVP